MILTLKESDGQLRLMELATNCIVYVPVVLKVWLAFCVVANTVPLFRQDQFPTGPVLVLVKFTGVPTLTVVDGVVKFAFNVGHTTVMLTLKESAGQLGVPEFANNWMV